jgi:gliding motility-associated-like protein
MWDFGLSRLYVFLLSCSGLQPHEQNNMHNNKPSIQFITCIFLMLVCIGTTCAQEICTNGVDDDNDGLIDLNDSEDCACTSVSSVTSLLPNPSFEVYDCLPTTLSELSCAETWEQATVTTSDYFVNVPGAFWDNIIPVPLPDGQGVAGFHICKLAIDPTLAVPEYYTYNEYIGGCLLAPIEAGVEYTIEMSLAGSSWNGLTASTGAYYGPIDITIYGSSACPEWPIILDTNVYGCPTVLEEWVELGHTSYSADETWQTITIQFTPDTDIQAVMIGGPCEVPSDFNADYSPQNDPNPPLPYFFIDNLLLNETSLFSSSIETTGSYCAEDLTLLGTSDTLAEYVQWYYNGVALPSQTNTQLAWSDLNLSEGTYQFIAFQNDSICAGSQIEVSLPPSITPAIEASTQSGCEPLSVQFNHVTPTPSIACEWDFGDGNTAEECNPTHVYTESGLYSIDIRVTFENGCTYDTTYQQYIEVTPPPQAVFTASPQPTTIDDTEITFTSTSTTAPLIYTWSFEDGTPEASAEENPVVNFPPIPGYYTISLVVENANGCVDSLSSFILIESDGTITLPNIFTPNGDGDNDRFVPFEAFPGNWILTIFNRWGVEVFATENLSQGWNGDDSPSATYYWVLQPRDEQQGENRAGYVMLVRD